MLGATRMALTDNRRSRSGRKKPFDSIIEDQTTTKGNRIRHVPMTARLREALRQHRHLRGQRVLYHADGEAMTASALIETVRAARRANLRNNGPHILRHTFCSHLAMRGAPPRAIQELAGIAICPRRSGTCT